MAPNEALQLNASERAALEEMHGSWPLNAIRHAFKPYAELMRVHRPAGIMIFYFPCLYGVFLAGILTPSIDVGTILVTNAKLFLLSFLMRTTFCTWNDILDQDLDRQITRTRIRPLARRAVSTTNALVFTAFQAWLLLSVFAFLPWSCFIYAIPFLLIHIVYPLTKRWTYHSQLVLGLGVALGPVIAFPALDLSLWPSGSLWSLSASDQTHTCSAVLLGAAIVLWTLLNDTIYEAQDLADDPSAGVKSGILYWGEGTRTYLRIMAVLLLLTLGALALVMRDSALTGGMVYAALTCGGTAIGLMWMIEGVDLKDPVSCGWWFHRGNMVLGWAIASGLIGEYLVGVN